MGGRAEGLLVSYRVSRKSRHLALAVCGEGARGLQPRLGLRLPAQSSIQSRLWVLLSENSHCSCRVPQKTSHHGFPLTRWKRGQGRDTERDSHTSRGDKWGKKWVNKRGTCWQVANSFLVPGRRTRGFARGSQPVNVKDAKCNPDLMPRTSQPGLDQTHCSEWSPS